MDTKVLPPATAANSQCNSSKSTAKEDKENSKKTKTTDDTENDDEIQYIEQPKKNADINSFDENAENIANEQQAKNYKQQNGISGKVSGSKLNSNKENSSKKGKNYSKPDLSSSAFANNKDEAAYIQK